MERVVLIGIAVLLDWLFGDPYWLPRPIRGIGWLIKKLEDSLKGFSINKRFQGIILWTDVVDSVFIVSWTVLWLLNLIHPFLFFK
ncbi:hypothetical protein BBF96_14835 [Anoxybacter fermentans]|uniref:Cobalamin biosynthesis protein CobD n=1 Tax=Anoxybacter fermentans TaxID=1323375 RepID=A0A3Q9HS70_9FIRM|nr:cobalamin biosynthesis protein [Anoxybacter fermentans]AZR74550.1 hypothetical protein BBF96_14835 [Anoxybacter fermentans]